MLVCILGTLLSWEYTESIYAKETTPCECCDTLQLRLGPSPLAKNKQYRAGSKSYGTLVPSLTRDDHAEGLCNPCPRWSYGDEIFDVSVFPGLRLLVEEVQGVQVAHTVSNEHHRPAGLLCHLFNHLLQLQEILFILIWKRNKQKQRRWANQFPLTGRSVKFPALPIVSWSTSKIARFQHSVISWLDQTYCNSSGPVGKVTLWVTFVTQNVSVHRLEWPCENKHQNISRLAGTPFKNTILFAYITQSHQQWLTNLNKYTF